MEKFHFPCETCGKAFRKKSNLQSHVLCHSKEKPFHCNEPGCNRYLYE
jgi:uncharacterized Zn-finger protein